VFKHITGIFHPDPGEIVFEGNHVSRLPPHTITTRGIARTFQTLRLFLNMSVLENVMVATYGHTRSSIVESMLQLPRSRREEKETRKHAIEKLAFFGQRLMGYRWDQPAYSLSYANRRRLEIARAMATGARLLLLDEPAAGMNPVETHEMTELIGKLRDDGGQDEPRAGEPSNRRGRVWGRGRHGPGDELPDRARDGDRAGEPPSLRADDRAREPANGRVPQRGRHEAGFRARVLALSTSPR